MKKINVVSVRLVRERAVSYARALTGPDAAVAVARELIEDSACEQFLVVHLDRKHRVMSAEVTAIGTESSVMVSKAAVFRGALLAGAVTIAVFHNHPSGLPDPSPEDFALTKALLEAGALLGVAVLDHIVIGHGCHASIRERLPGLAWG